MSVHLNGKLILQVFVEHNLTRADEEKTTGTIHEMQAFFRKHIQLAITHISYLYLILQLSPNLLCLYVYIYIFLYSFTAASFQMFL